MVQNNDAFEKWVREYIPHFETMAPLYPVLRAAWIASKEHYRDTQLLKGLFYYCPECRSLIEITEDTKGVAGILFPKATEKGA